MSGSLESLVVDLKLDAAALRSGLNEAAGLVGNFGTKVEDIGKKIHSLTQMEGFKIGKELVTGLAEFIQKGAEATERIGLMSQAAGTSTENFSRMSYAANLSGVSTEDLGVAFKKLDVNLAAAGAGTKKQSALFSALGISVKDSSGHVRDSAAVMGDLANKFSQYQDGASKSALAVEIFGKAGASLIPFLNEGAEGLAKFSAEADALGITVSGAAASSAKEFEDDLKRLNAIAGATERRIAAELTPALTRLTEQLIHSSTAASDLNHFVEVISVAIKGLLTVGVAIITVFDGLTTSIAHVIAAGALAATGDFKSALLALKNTGGDMEKTLETLSKRLGAIWNDAGPGKEKGEGLKRTMDGIMRGAVEGEKGLTTAEAAIKSLTKTVEEYETKAAEAGAGESWVDRMNAMLDTGKIASELKEAGAEGEALRDRLVKAFTEIHDVAAAKLSMKVDFDISRTAASTGRATEQRTTAFSNAGASQTDQNAVARAGFDSFGSALSTWAKETDHYTRLIGTVEMLRSEKEDEAANRTQLFADTVQAAAEKAGKAADAWLAKATEDSVRQQAIVNTFVSQITSRLGEVGQVIGAAAQGMATAGPWGAIIAVIGELASKMESFMTLVDYLNKDLGTHLQTLSKVLAPLFKTFQTLGEATNTLLNSFQPLQWVFTTISAIMWALGKTVIATEMVFLQIAKSWNEATGQNTTTIKAQLKALGDQFNEGFVDPMNQLGDTAEKVSAKFSDMLTNLPSGYKLGAALFGADQGIGGSGGGSGGAGGMGKGGGGGGGTAAPPGWSSSDDPNYAGANFGNHGYEGAGTNPKYDPNTGAGKDQQIQTSESTRPGAVDQAGYNANGVALLPPDATYWAAFNAALAQGYDYQTAMSIAYQAQLNERGSGSGAATATPRSGVTNIGSSKNGGIQQVAGGADAGGGDTTIINIDKVELANARGWDDLVRKITETQHQQAGQAGQRNPTRTKGRG